MTKPGGPAAGTLLVLLTAFPLVAQQDSLLVQGVVRDSMSQKPIPFAIVRVADSDITTLAAWDGRYRLRLASGRWELQFRKIGYRMAARSLVVDRAVTLDVAMSPIPVQLEAVEVRGVYENPALAIMRRAIARKNDVLARIRDYQYEAYVKLAVRDLNKHEDSTASVVVITETETTAYWRRPDEYQEVITARRQSRNLETEYNLTSVGEIVNFNKDRIDIGKYSVASPTADDALAFYDYHVVDTLWDGAQMVYRLAVEPRSPATPLFVGMIDIADSTFDVRAIDVGANAAVRFEFFENLRYRQRLEQVGNDAWMPTEIRFSGELHIGVPIPGLPNHMTFSHTAVLENFRFDTGDAPGTLGEYRVVVDREADDRDSTYWALRRTIPLSDTERAAWARIDSIESLPPSFGAWAAGVALGAFTLSNRHDFFHFNRVEGPYVGAGVTLRDISPDLIVRAKTGYGFDRKRWQHLYGAQVRLAERQRLWLGAWYRDEVVPRPTIVSQGRNATFSALFGKVDPLDYHRERGVIVGIRTRLVDFVHFQLQYSDLAQSSLEVVSDYAVFEPDRVQRPNPPILDGRLRSISGTISYDSRPLLKQKGRDYYLNQFTYTQLVIGAELAEPGLVATDFDYVRYFLRLRRRQRTLNLGLTTITAVLGGAFGRLPPQRYFTVDFGNWVFFQDEGFNTLDRTNFSGNRAAMLYVSHDFDQQLFRRSRIPLFRDVPFTLSVHGGVFWTDFIDHAPNPGDELVATAPRPYGEIGFGLGNLTPWFSPLNLAAWLTWQVTGYDTDRFVVRLGVPGF